MKTSLFTFTFIVLTALSAQAKELIIKDSEGLNCYVYLPDKLDSSKEYQLVVGVHGYNGNGKGAAGLAKWANRGDVIVIGPSFAKGAPYYQLAGDKHSKKLLSIVKKLKKDYSLKEKFFIHGFSGGAQFTHRFAMKHHRYLCGVSAHSGGSWATGGSYGKISTAAKKIPFAISCGEKDTKKSVPSSPMNRLEWYKAFAKEMEKKKFCYVGAVIKNTGHRANNETWSLCEQCFQLATGLPGGKNGKEVTISAEWKNLDLIDK